MFLFSSVEGISVMKCVLKRVKTNCMAGSSSAGRSLKYKSRKIFFNKKILQ